MRWNSQLAERESYAMSERKKDKGKKKRELAGNDDLERKKSNAGGKCKNKTKEEQTKERNK